MQKKQLKKGQKNLFNLDTLFQMLVRIIKSYRDIVIICDSDLIGKKFGGDKFQLDLKGEFFKGEETSEEKTMEIM